MSTETKIPGREPDLEFWHNNQHLSFWWKERVQTNYAKYEDYTSVFNIDVTDLRYHKTNWHPDDWQEYESFLTASEFKALKESYAQWLLEKAIKEN